MSELLPEVDFHSTAVNFIPKSKSQLRQWIVDTFRAEKKALSSLHFIFCSDEYLLGINKEFLDHDDYTDVITFDYGHDSEIEGEIYISVDRVRDNANSMGQNFDDELHRVMIHGVLHLCGYGDSKPEDKRVMTRKEDYYLNLRSF